MWKIIFKIANVANFSSCAEANVYLYMYMFFNKIYTVKIYVCEPALYNERAK